MRILIPCLFLLKWCLANQPDLPYDPTDQNEVCWERCFQIEDNDLERFREVYDDFYKMGMEARKLKNMFGINGTAILLDSTLSSQNPIEPWQTFYSVSESRLQIKIRFYHAFFLVTESQEQQCVFDMGFPAQSSSYHHDVDGN